MRIFAAACVGLLLVACKGGDSGSAVEAPGSEKSARTAALEAGAAALQRMPPIGAINAYLDGFHFYNGRMEQQMEAHHYCAMLNDDVIQCVIYDGNGKDAKLMGLEYIVSERVFSDLPPAEKSLWHSHVHEVKSGQLIAPGIPQVAEHALMAKLIHTYGKTWHTWHTDSGARLPLGVPQLMMGFTADGQSDPSLVESRDRRFGIDSKAKAADRTDIQAPPIDPGADAWQRGTTIQLSDPRMPK
ncbi:MAG TPA: OBAP family protein [Steroidobacteraceae bacterium]|nr:OBAP family protein [Steroidobacteraceae bacterium]